MRIAPQINKSSAVPDCASKNPISPKVFASARRCCGRPFGWKVSGVQVFYFCNGEVKTLRIDNIWNIATFNLYTGPAKIVYLQRYSTDFRNLSSARRSWGWTFGWKVSSAQIFYVWNGNVKIFVHWQHLKFCNFQHVHCGSKNPISPKVFNRFSKSLPQLEDVGGGHFSGMFPVCRQFTFAMATWKLGASTTFEILPHSTCTFSQQKSDISKDTQPIFEIFASARRCWGWAFAWKISSAQGFYVCNGNVKTFCIDNIWNFATFNLCTVLAKILYLQRYSTDFRNLCLSSKMLRVGIWVERFKCEGILRLQWQCENFVHWQHLKFCNFQRVLCASKNAISPKVFTDFRNPCSSSKMLRVGIWVESFRCAGILLLQWQGENSAHRQYLKYCHFQPVYWASKNPIFPKILNWFSKSLPQLEDVEGEHLGGKFQVRRYFTFAMAMGKLCALKTFEILPLSTCTLCQKKSYISKGFQSIFEIFPQLQDVDGGHLGGKYQVHRYFSFAIARWKLCASATFEILPPSTCTMCH